MAKLIIFGRVAEFQPLITLQQAWIPIIFAIYTFYGISPKIDVLPPGYFIHLPNQLMIEQFTVVQLMRRPPYFAAIYRNHRSLKP
ncbi:hypothetical protein D3C77_594870 [compost metagenome]